jgi:hypothetical protein
MMPFHAAERFKKRRKKREDCLSEASFAAPVFFKNVKDCSLKANQVNGCPFFWFVFFGQAKKMNKQNKFIKISKI